MLKFCAFSKSFRFRFYKASIPLRNPILLPKRAICNDGYGGNMTDAKKISKVQTQNNGSYCNYCGGYKQQFYGMSPISRAIIQNQDFVVQVLDSSGQNVYASGFFVEPDIILTCLYENSEYVMVRNRLFQQRAKVVNCEAGYVVLKLDNLVALPTTPVIRRDVPFDLEEVATIGFAERGMNFPAVTPTVGHVMCCGEVKDYEEKVEDYEEKVEEVEDYEEKVEDDEEKVEDYVEKVVAKVYPYILTSCTEVREMMGGPVVDREGRILGIAAGRIKRPECDQAFCQLVYPIYWKSTTDPGDLVEQSIKHAKEAVMLDVKDENSRYAPGNANLTSSFMTGAWDHTKLQQSLKAYQNAVHRAFATSGSVGAFNFRDNDSKQRLKVCYDWSKGAENHNRKDNSPQEAEVKEAL